MFLSLSLPASIFSIPCKSNSFFALSRRKLSASALGAPWDCLERNLKMYPFCDIPGASIQTFFHTVPHVLLTIYQIGGVAITITAADRIQIPLRLVLSPCSVTLGPYKWQGAALPVNSLCRTPSFLPFPPFILSHFASVLWTASAGVRSLVRCSPPSLARSSLRNSLGKTEKR